MGKRGDGEREGERHRLHLLKTTFQTSCFSLLVLPPPLSSRLVKMKEIFPLFSTGGKVGGGMEVSAVERSDTKICAENEIAR